MTAIPEFLFHTIIASGIDYIRKNLEVMDMIFPQISRKTLQGFKEFFVENKIKFYFGQLHVQPEIPYISMLLQNEDEHLQYIGDFIGVGPDPYWVNGEYSPVLGEGGSKIHKGFFYDPDDPEGPHDWDEAPVDRSSKLIGDHRKLFKIDDTLKERYGIGFKAAMVFRICGGDFWNTLLLYNTVRYIFAKGKLLLIHNGVYDIIMSGTDMAPNAPALPSLAYTRSLVVRFIYNFDYYSSQEDGMAKAIAIQLTSVVNQPNVNAPCDMLTKDYEEHEETYTWSVIGQPPVIESVVPSSISAGTGLVIEVSGSNLHYGALVTFSDISSIVVTSTEFIAGQKLRVTFDAPSPGVTDVVVDNPDGLYSTLEDGLEIV